ncbi:MAG: DUF4384 domain-containing protein [Rhodospirillaceae bacterium]|nr:DUF4384 domain-containing protein [Rhodospirillaceae bacterium]MBT7975177.1 DUF4384 domain-containing protein [Rhodospirillaceae bacterium]
MTSASEAKAKQSYLQKAYGYMRPKRTRIAVAPFEQDDIKIAKAVADDFNASLFAALIKKGGRYDLMAREALKALIDDMQQTGAWEAADGNPINALLKNAGNIDVLIRGKIRVSGKTAVLTYTAISMDGRVVAQTLPQHFPLSSEDAKISRPTVSLDSAVAAAARHLADRAPELEELLQGGVRFEDTGTQPPFGSYLQGRVAGAIREAFSSVVTSRTIKVGRLQAHRGLKSGGAVSGKDLLDRNLSGKASAHVLSGSYWQLSNSIELRLNLKGPEGSNAEWVGWISSQDTAGRRVRPMGNFGSLRDYDGMGPFAFQLTSDRGKNAAYSFGDRMKLLIRLDRTAWVYCFYRDAVGSTVQIFPNPHFWQNHKQPRFEGGVLHTMPDDPTFNFDFVVSPPTGQELVKCFAVSRDVTADLPPELRGNTLKPMPRDLGMRLSPTFRELPDAAVSEASFVVTVGKQ